MVGNQLQTLCGWLHSLPESLVLAHPSLRLIHALALMYTNHWEEASAHLQAVERGIDPGEDMQTAQERLLLGQVTACWSLLARLSSNLERVLPSRIAHWTCYPRWILLPSRTCCVREPYTVPPMPTW